jgi:hypothetical protein
MQYYAAISHLDAERLRAAVQQATQLASELPESELLLNARRYATTTCAGSARKKRRNAQREAR